MNMTTRRPPARLLVVPGLGDSPAGHWQTWLQAAVTGAVRVKQRDWSTPDLDRWACRVGSTLDRSSHSGPWLVAAHSFGVLAVLRYLQLSWDPRLAALLLVAPAHPDRFGIAGLLPQDILPLPSTMVLSTNDPWLKLSTGQQLARRWGALTVNLGAAGHINIDSGFGPWPYARRWVTAQEQRLARLARPPRSAGQEWSFAV